MLESPPPISAPAIGAPAASVSLPEGDPGTKTYTFTRATIADIGVSPDVIPGLMVDIIENGTRAVFWTDEAGGTDAFFDEGIDTLWFDNVLDQGDFSDAGSYTFTSYQDPPEVFSLFGFNLLPSGPA